MSFDVAVHRFLVIPGNFYERCDNRDMYLEQNVMIVRT